MWRPVRGHVGVVLSPQKHYWDYQKRDCGSEGLTRNGSSMYSVLLPAMLALVP